jgi:2-polyprenyl-3-methyl-5-hydroxy-6-metoxy-1,4-benzoquinol methylase
MPVVTKSFELQYAEKWAQSLWNTSGDRWTTRKGQDITYRSCVVHPALERMIDQRMPQGPLSLLDLGCGDGILLEDARIRDRIVHGGKYLGIDMGPDLLSAAYRIHHGGSSRYLQSDLTDPGLPDAIRNLGRGWNCVLSVFVVQEIPDIAAFFRNLNQLLEPDAFAVIITVHPAFAEWLRYKGRLPVEEDVSPGETSDMPLWRWAGSYPIVDEPAAGFPLPHFQRTADDYRRFITEAGLRVESITDVPSIEELTRFRAEGFSPFREFPGNAYWPRIAEAPSSIAFTITREMSREKA